MKKFWAIMITLLMLMVLSLSLTTGCETSEEAATRADEDVVPATPSYD